MQLSIKKKESSGREPFNAKDLRRILAKETFLNNPKQLFIVSLAVILFN